MNTRKVAIGAIVVVIGLPLAIILGVILTVNVLDRTSGTLVSDGEEREYLLHVPERYDPASPVPLVISFHAAAMWPASQQKTSEWNEVADRHGFIVVYPAGSGAPKAWHPSPAGARLDARFVSHLIDTLQARYSIDPSRIYANGLSNGGHMAFVLSCELAHRIAAVGTVAAAHQLPWSWCESSTPVPLIAFHGTADPLVPYKGGVSSMATEPFPSASEFAATWARRNGCGREPIESQVASDVSLIDYTGCVNDAKVVFYSIDEGGHTWPGGRTALGWVVGRTSNSIQATSLMWDFFRKHRLGGRDSTPDPPEGLGAAWRSGLGLKQAR